jgi:hypothetical protein
MNMLLSLQDVAKQVTSAVANVPNKDAAPVLTFNMNDFVTPALLALFTAACTIIWYFFRQNQKQSADYLKVQFEALNDSLKSLRSYIESQNKELKDSMKHQEITLSGLLMDNVKLTIRMDNLEKDFGNFQKALENHMNLKVHKEE